MSGIPGIPQNLLVQQANQQVLISWDLSTGADSYLVQRSLDNVTYTALTTITGSPLATSHLDTTVTVGTQYWYKVAASNVSGVSSYTTAGTCIPSPTSELSLYELRQRSQQKADRLDSQFVTIQ